MPFLSTGTDLADTDPPLLQIDLDNFAVQANIDVVLVPKYLRGPLYKSLNTVDSPADKIRNPSGGVGYVGTLLKTDDFQLGPAAARLGGGTHPGSVTTDYYQAFSRHKRSLLAGPHAITRF